MIPQEHPAHNPQQIRDLADQLHAFVGRAAAQGMPAHEAERGIWQQILALGRAALGQFFALQGQGDLGPTLNLPDGQTVHRLDDPHPRDYRSVFGDFRLQRAVYGTREGQKIALVPLDARLQLPQSDYSYLLQAWDQALGCEFAFGRVAATLYDVLGLKQSVDSLERMNRAMAELVGPFRQARPRPPADQEGEVVVTQADGKGVVMRRQAGEAKIHGHRQKGQKASKKRMAVVGTTYTIGRMPRTAQEVVESLFRDPKAEKPKGAPRPRPVHKHVWASLPQPCEGGEVPATEVVFRWLGEEHALRNPGEPRSRST